MEIMEGADSKAKKLPQYFAALVVSLGAFTYGTSMGWTSICEAKIISELNRPIEEVAWIGSLLHLGGAVIMLPLPFVLNRLGRKTIMLITVVPLVAAWVITSVASQITAPVTAVILYCLGQFFSGVCEAVFCVVAPIYIGEIGQKEIRGTLLVFFQLLLSCGILYAYIVGSLTTILGLSIACGAVPIVFGILLLFIPETPYYYMMNRKYEDATESLKWFRGKECNIASEINEVEKSALEREEATGSFKENLAKPGATKALVIGIGAILCQRLSGVSSMSLHLELIFEMTGANISGDNSLLIIAIIQIASTSIASLIVDKMGRKIVLFASMFVMGISHIILGAYFVYYDKDKHSVEFINWLPVLMLCTYFSAYCLGAGSVTWTILGEIFPNEIKNIAVPICILLNWITGFIMAFTFHFIVEGLGRSGPFWIYASLCAAGALFALFVCIETKGKTLQEIQILLAGGKNELPLNTIRQISTVS